MKQLLDLHRYTSNFLGWGITWDKICEEIKLPDVDLTAMKTMAAEEIMNAKPYLPVKVQDDAKIINCSSAQELLAGEAKEAFHGGAYFPFAALALCNSSIYNSMVYLEDKTIVYESTADNTFFFPVLLLMDYMINTYILLRNNFEEQVVIIVNINNHEEKLENIEFYKMLPVMTGMFPSIELRINALINSGEKANTGIILKAENTEKERI